MLAPSWLPGHLPSVTMFCGLPSLPSIELLLPDCGRPVRQLHLLRRAVFCLHGGKRLQSVQQGEVHMTASAPRCAHVHGQQGHCEQGVAKSVITDLAVVMTTQARPPTAPTPPPSSNQGYYLDANKKCIACPDGCAACTSGTFCTECTIAKPKFCGDAVKKICIPAAGCCNTPLPNTCDPGTCPNDGDTCNCPVVSVGMKKVKAHAVVAYTRR